MPDPLLPSGDGGTALDEDDRRGLIPAYISTRAELYAAEQRNIARALLRAPPRLTAFLDDGYLRALHKSMFGEVWGWAGQYRSRETNIGIAPREISSAVLELVRDAAAWVDHSTFPPDEVALRFHHRLVAIHAFPNGNGRHGRVAADFLIHALGRDPFTWGYGLDLDTAGLRRAYRDSLVRADGGDMTRLLEFARQ